jgi:hypothetical protein
MSGGDLIFAIRDQADVRVGTSVPWRPSIEPLAFPEDTAPASDAQLKLDWFSTDLYSFALDKFRQG